MVPATVTHTLQALPTGDDSGLLTGCVPEGGFHPGGLTTVARLI